MLHTVVGVVQKRRGALVLEQQRYLMPLEVQLESLQKAIITARGLKRRDLEFEIKVSAAQ
jgi:hypothetical protein